jgi:hypothetical protein
MVNNAKNSRSIKYSVNIKGSLPSSVKVFTNPMSRICNP